MPTRAEPEASDGRAASNSTGIQSTLYTRRILTARHDSCNAAMVVHDLPHSFDLALQRLAASSYGFTLTTAFDRVRGFLYYLSLKDGRVCPLDEQPAVAQLVRSLDRRAGPTDVGRLVLGQRLNWPDVLDRLGAMENGGKSKLHRLAKMAKQASWRRDARLARKAARRQIGRGQ